MKEHFIVKDNVLDKGFTKVIQESKFSKRKGIDKLRKDVIEVVADLFTGGRIKKAMKILESDEKRVRRNDMFVLSFFGGGTLLMVCLLAIDLIREHGIFSQDQTAEEAVTRQTNFWAAIKSANPIYRFAFLMSYILFATGFCVKVY